MASCPSTITGQACATLKTAGLIAAQKEPSMLAQLIEGLTDAIGFVVGALLGYGLGVGLGLNLFAEGYGASSIAAIVLVGIGGGLGLQTASRLRARAPAAE
jgi:hypothetical protein